MGEPRNSASIQKQKMNLRKQFLEERSKISDRHRNAWNLEVQRRLVELFSTEGRFNPRNIRTVGLYAPVRGEVDVLPTLPAWHASGVKCAFPCTSVVDKRMTFYVVEPGEPLQVGAYGIREPAPIESRRVLPRDFSALLIPGVAFSPGGARLGYGGGFYDRFLPLVRRDCIRIGVAFEVQITEPLPVSVHDTPVDFVVTESRIIACT